MHTGEYFTKITLLSKSHKALDLHFVSPISSYNLFWYHRLASVLLLQNVCFSNKNILGYSFVKWCPFISEFKECLSQGLKWRNPMALSVWSHWFISFHCIVFVELMGKVKQILLPGSFSKMVGASLSSLNTRYLF